MTEPSFYPAQHQHSECCFLRAAGTLQWGSECFVHSKVRSWEWSSSCWGLMTFIKRARASPGIRNILLIILVSLGTPVITQGLELSLCLSWNCGFIQRFGWWLEWRQYLDFLQKYQMLGNGSINNTNFLLKEYFLVVFYELELWLSSKKCWRASYYST